jgi:lipoyl(octanoyl) transferase
MSRYSSFIIVLALIASFCIVITALQKQQLGVFQPIFSPLSNIEGYSLSELQRKRRIQLVNFLKTDVTEKEAKCQEILEKHENLLDYRDVWNLQKRLVENHINRLQQDQTLQEENLASQYHELGFSSTTRVNLSSLGNEHENSGQGNDIILMLQHNPVYTLGTGSDERFILGEHKNSKFPIEVVRIERGGEVTYHGPGQLVVYPILDLRRYNQDVHWYIRALEEAVLLALHSVGVKGGTREEAVTGVWVSNKKIAAIGIKVRRWVTMHGLAVNVDKRSIENFSNIVPCGLYREVGFVNDYLESPISVEEFSAHMVSALETVFHATLVESRG